MDVNELQHIVELERLILLLFIVIIIASCKHLPLIMILSLSLTISCVITIWSSMTALACIMIVIPISYLLWVEMEPNTSNLTAYKDKVVTFAWSSISFGIFVMISQNLYKIFDTLT